MENLRISLNNGNRVDHQFLHNHSFSHAMDSSSNRFGTTGVSNLTASLRINAFQKYWLWQRSLSSALHAIGHVCFRFVLVNKYETRSHGKHAGRLIKDLIKQNILHRLIIEVNQIRQNESADKCFIAFRVVWIVNGFYGSDIDLAFNLSNGFEEPETCHNHPSSGPRESVSAWETIRALMLHIFVTRSTSFAKPVFSF